MRILIATVFLIATTVFLSICPSLPSALASTLDTSVLLLAQTQPIPTTSSTDASTTSAPSSTDSSLTSPTLSSSDFSFTSSDFDKLVRPQTSAQNVNWSNLVLLVTAIVSSSLLMAMVLWVSLGQSNSPVKDGTQSTPNIDGLEQKGDFIVKSFPTVIEGITVYLIVAVVAVLSLSATIQPEGTISIISGISGYVLGRQSSKGGKSQGD